MSRVDKKKNSHRVELDWAVYCILFLHGTRRHERRIAVFSSLALFFCPSVVGEKRALYLTVHRTPWVNKSCLISALINASLFSTGAQIPYPCSKRKGTANVLKGFLCPSLRVHGCSALESQRRWPGNAFALLHGAGFVGQEPLSSKNKSSTEGLTV